MIIFWQFVGVTQVVDGFYFTGFRKIDPDRWEFANDWFLRGQKHLLTNISRRKSSYMHNQQLQPLHQNPPVASCVEVGKFGLDEEIEMLKRDKNVLMQELVRLRQQQQTTDTQLQAVTKCLLGMEERQQQMMSFLAKALHSPEFFTQLMQQNNADNNPIPRGNKKQKFPNQVELEGESASSDGQIIKHQPTKSMHKQKLTSDKSPSSDTSCKHEGIAHVGNYHLPDCSRISISMSEVASQDVSLSMRMPNVPASSGISAAYSCSAVSEVQSAPIQTDSGKNILSADIGFQEFAPVQGVSANESAAEFLSLDFSASEAESIPFSPLAGVDELIPAELENFSGDSGIDVFNASGGMKLPLAVVPFWEQLISAGLISGDTEDVGSSLIEANEIPKVEVKKAWNRVQNMDNLTEQMKLLISNARTDGF